MRVWRLLGEYNAETTTYSECAGTAQTSPYTPDFSGRLVALRCIVGGGAATSLVNHIQFRMTCTTFKPNVLHCAGQGSGLQTAPAVKIGEVLDWPCDQPVQSGVPITVEGRNVNAATPVTVDAMIYGLFELS